MSTPEEKEILLSQLVDQELPPDQAAEVLLSVLDDAGPRGRLQAMLRARQALAPWRRQEPARALVAVLPAHPPAGHSLAAWRLLGLAAAALLGGVLVGGGIYLGRQLGSGQHGTSLVRPSLVVVTPGERREIARAFALHESVAGPLSWYAADEATIQVAPPQKGETLRSPIAVILRLTPDPSCHLSKDAVPKTYVIVCRGSDAAAMELPAAAMAKALRLRLLPTAVNGEVNLQYALAAEGTNQRPGDAGLAGRRHVGLGQTPLGQLALDDCLVNVDASAWVMAEASKP